MKLTPQEKNELKFVFKTTKEIVLSLAIAFFITFLIATL